MNKRNNNNNPILLKFDSTTLKCRYFLSAVGGTANSISFYSNNALQFPKRWNQSFLSYQ